MANANAVVPAVKPGADPEPLPHLTEPQPHVGVLKALAELGDGHNGNELPRRNTNQLRHRHQNHVAQQVVEQVVAVVAPHRHLLLRMVQRMQSPPPLEVMLPPMDPVVHKIKYHQIQQQTDPGDVRHTRPDAVELEGADTCHTQRTKQRIRERVYCEEQRQTKQPQPVDQGVEDVGADGGAVIDRFHRPPALHRTNHGHDDHQLQQAHQQPSRSLIAVLQQAGQPCGEHQRLQHALKKPLLHAVKYAA